MPSGVPDAAVGLRVVTGSGVGAGDGLAAMLATAAIPTMRRPIERKPAYRI
jgi:hypothetical protein